jgi:SpoVK/Ycf46/Vps4 family AAA+-type ATPase
MQVTTSKLKESDSSPKGDAFTELTAMIGLSEAKAIIKQMIDYNKAQRFFIQNEIKQEHNTMHMIFTGNPGTAKTTVARLIAQIMKDNDLLSVGRLVEVSRADLVGRYVGWTAQIVKAKFQEAKGSVLFLDEAYSLIDNKTECSVMRRLIQLFRRWKTIEMTLL